MNFDAATLVSIGVIVALLAIVFGASFLRFKPRPLNIAYFQKKWQEAQNLCKDKTTWPLAIINADKLLDEALKKRHYKGKTMGERLVSAQRMLTNNDGVWFGHKLRNRVVHEDTKLREGDVKKALLGLRQALKDLGALK
jgi:hypothetical protein